MAWPQSLWFFLGRASLWWQQSFLAFLLDGFRGSDGAHNAAIIRLWGSGKSRGWDRQEAGHWTNGLCYILPLLLLNSYSLPPGWYNVWFCSFMAPAVTDSETVSQVKCFPDVVSLGVWLHIVVQPI